MLVLLFRHLCHAGLGIIISHGQPYKNNRKIKQYQCTKQKSIFQIVWRPEGRKDVLDEGIGFPSLVDSSTFSTLLPTAQKECSCAQFRRKRFKVTFVVPSDNLGSQPYCSPFSSCLPRNIYSALALV